MQNESQLRTKFQPHINKLHLHEKDHLVTAAVHFEKHNEHQNISGEKGTEYQNEKAVHTYRT
jgi:hypothetical protein